MKITEQDHRDYVTFLFGEGQWVFDRYHKGKSHWKAANGGKGTMSFTDGWVFHWKREQARKQVSA